MRIIKLVIEDKCNLNEQEGLVKDLIAMDSKSIVVGFPSGGIKVFNRKNLKLEKVLHNLNKYYFIWMLKITNIIEELLFLNRLETFPWKTPQVC